MSDEQRYEDDRTTTREQGLVPQPLDTSGRHPVNVGHLVMGVALLGLTGIWLLFETGAIGTGDLRWLMPLPWLAAGVAGLLAVVLTGRRRGGTTY
jgi:Flp pilus assembly protein protease CpaA